MNDFKALIQEFKDTLRKYNPINYEKLYKPMSEESVNYYLNQFGINDFEFKELFLWKNGFDFDIDPKNICQIFELDTFLSIESITETIALSRKHNLWNELFIPLMTDATGQYILFDNNYITSSYGQLCLYSASLLIFEPTSCYDSISSLIETTIAAYKEGVLKYDTTDDWVDLDVKKYNEIAFNINKKSKYWKFSQKKLRYNSSLVNLLEFRQMAMMRLKII